MSTTPVNEFHREALGAQGLRPVEVWVPDTFRPGFAEECSRQSLSLRDDPQEQEILAWLDDTTVIEVTRA